MAMHGLGGGKIHILQKKAGVFRNAPVLARRSSRGLSSCVGICLRRCVNLGLKGELMLPGRRAVADGRACERAVFGLFQTKFLRIAHDMLLWFRRSLAKDPPLFPVLKFGIRQNLDFGAVVQ